MTTLVPRGDGCVYLKDGQMELKGEAIVFMDTECLGLSIIMANSLEGLIICLAVPLNYPHNPMR